MSSDDVWEEIQDITDNPDDDGRDDPDLIISILEQIEHLLG